MIKGHAISFYIKYYKNPYLAPLGKYIKLEYINYIYHIEDFDLKDLASYVQNNEVFKLNIKPEYSVSGLSFEFGSQRILFNRLIINGGLQLGFLFKGLKGLNFYNNHFNDSAEQVKVTVDDYFDHVTCTRLFSMFLINFKLGIGLLAL